VRKPIVLDGEIVVMSGDTPLRFQDLQSRMHVNDRASIEGHRGATPAALIAFDMLLDGKATLVTEPWRRRRKHLVALLQPPGRRTKALRLSTVHTDGPHLLHEARQREWEGVIAKRADVSYEPGRRSGNWRKLKLEQRQEFVVGGWTEPRRSRQHIGALLLGYYNDAGELIYAGHTGTGFTRAGLAEVYKLLARTERKTSPFSTTPKTNEAAHWTRPQVVVEIKFNEWTTDGRLRQPVYLGVRDDKAAKDVRHEPASIAARAGAAATPQIPETPADRVRIANDRHVAASATKPTSRSKKARTAYASDRGRSKNAMKEVIAQLETLEASSGAGLLQLPTEGRELEVSKLDKVFFPQSGHTKGDVMRFYVHVAPYLLPAITDRPLVMKRFPNGVGGKAFYQQKAPADPPPVVRVETVSDEGLTTADRLVGGDLATLLYLVQLGAISVDPWHSRVASVQDADYAIIDLDPGTRAPFTRVVEVACVVKEVLDAFGLHAVPKTSGASGMHIAIPLGAGIPNDGARMIAELVATTVVERIPKFATVERAVKARATTAVYVDFLQNIRGKTVAGVYSVRAQATPTVSTPLTWDEVTPELDPSAFTIDTVPARLDKIGDLWAKGMRTPNTLDGLLKHV
jgi:bifunctional non-homologous end joining protein LigD